jgi:hypothetical protein
MMATAPPKLTETRMPQTFHRSRTLSSQHRDQPSAADLATVALGLQTPASVPADRLTGPFPRSTSENFAMAEIRVEPRRRSLAWLWILIALIVIGGLVYYFMFYNGQP